MVPADRDALLAEGFGDYHYGDGEPIVDRMPDDSPAPAPGPGARRLARLIHTTDVHLADDESPARLASFDGPPPLDGAARPQDAFMGRVLNAAVRTVNALHRDEPIDLLMLGGDSTDSALSNELGWVIDILSGSAAVSCDSGALDDPIAGANNDPKDPFVAAGLEIPWRFCMGNHDALMMGITQITDFAAQSAVGNQCASGARDWSQPGGPVSAGEWIADERRRPLARAEMLEQVAADADGHGLADRPQPDKASYTFDLGEKLRFVVYDTASETGGDEGLVRRSDLDAFLQPALDQAAADGKWVVLVSHHSLGSISDGHMADEEAQAEAVLAAEMQETFLAYDNIILSLTGHSHNHRVHWVGGAGSTGFWEVQTCSLIEFPNQMRLVEITNEDNGHLAITVIGVDFATDDDDVAEQGRRLALLDHTAGWGGGDPGTIQDRNVKLHVPVPS